MVLVWALAVSGALAAGALCLRFWYRRQSKLEAARIVRAIEASDIDELAMLWAERAYSDAVRDWFGNPPLILAARNAAPAAELLLCFGVEVDERGVGWMTALMHAAAAGDERLCELLLAHGADPDARDGFGREAAWFAARGGHEVVARRLRRAASRELL
jgi:hypothetical protein